MMPLPTELLNVALLGTDQGSLATSDLNVDELLQKNSDLSKEARLLLASAGIALRDLAGFMPPQLTRETPAPAPEETAPVVNMAALRHLMVMLEGHHDEVLPEWLKAVAAAGKRIPEEALPLLLDMGRKQTALRDLIIPVIGERGRWLAQEATSKEWGWIAHKNPEKIWQEGDRTKRSEVLDAVRKRDPQKGRELLQSTWAKEKADERERFIFSLWHGISADDEPFLEDALDDAAQAVRKTAQEMLATIPESHFYARMVERAEAHINLKKGKKGPLSFEFTFPADLDKSMERDRFVLPDNVTDEKKPQEIMAYILEHMRPEWWLNHFGIVDIADLLKAFDNTKTPIDLYLALLKGAYLANNIETIEYLLTHHMKKFTLAYAVLPSPASLLSPAAAERVLMNLLSNPQSWFDKPEQVLNAASLVAIVESVSLQWSEDLTKVLLSLFRSYLEGGQTTPYPPVKKMLKHLAFYLPPQMSDQIMSVIDVPTKTEKAWGEVVDHLRFTLEFRRDMPTAIKEN